MHQIIQLSCEGSGHHTATHLLKTSQPPPEALCAGHFTKPHQSICDIWPTFDATFVKREGLLHASHEWV